MKKLLVVSAVLILVIIAYFYYSDWNRDKGYRAVVHKNACRLNLLLIWDAANRYVVKNNDLPRDSNGNFSLTVLKDQFQPDLDLSCPSRHDLNEIDYEITKDISVDDFKKSNLPVRVIGAEKTINHFGDRRILLLSNRTVYEVPVKVGEKTSPNFPWDFQIPIED